MQRKVSVEKAILNAPAIERVPSVRLYNDFFSLLLLLLLFAEHKPWYVNGTMSAPPEAHYDEFENIKSHAKQQPTNYDMKNRWTSNSYDGNSGRSTSGAGGASINNNNTDMDYAEPKYDLGMVIYHLHL